MGERFEGFSNLTDHRHPRHPSADPLPPVHVLFITDAERIYIVTEPGLTGNGFYYPFFPKDGAAPGGRVNLGGFRSGTRK